MTARQPKAAAADVAAAAEASATVAGDGVGSPAADQLLQYSEYRAGPLRVPDRDPYEQLAAQVREARRSRPVPLMVSLSRLDRARLEVLARHRGVRPDVVAGDMIEQALDAIAGGAATAGGDGS